MMKTIYIPPMKDGELLAWCIAIATLTYVYGSWAFEYLSNIIV